ncbi:g9222 [Coccomyxa elongata]
MVISLRTSTLTLLLLLPLLVSAYRVRGGADETLREVPGHRYKGPYHSHGSVLQKFRALQRLRAAEWDLRMQPVQGLLDSYKERHNACVNSKTLPGKYLVVRMEDKDAGIGNQLPSVVTGFLLALMMDRCLFVDFPFFNKYFDHELDFSWEHHAERLLAHGHNATAPEDAPLMIPFGYKAIADLWMYRNMTEYFHKYYGALMFKDLDYSAALLVNNPHHQEFIDKYFPTRDIFAPLASFILRIRPEFDNKIKEFKHLNFKLFNIGLQIRRRKCNRDPNEVSCELRPSVEAYCTVARHIQLSHGIHDDDVRFFVAADEPEIYTQVVKILGADRVIFTDNGISPNSSLRGVENPAQNKGTLESALQDMALMSHCNDLVMTLASSFGYVAAAWGGYAPVHMVYGRHTTSQNPYWYRAISSEPCYWQTKNMMRALDDKAVQRFRSNPLWMQYTQCHYDWDT